MKTRSLLATLLAMAMAATALADYMVSTDTTYGNGSTVTWGTAPFTGDFIFDFLGGTSSLTFANRIHLNGNNVTFGVPSGKTATISGGIENTSASSSDTAAGAIVREDASYTGTLQILNGIDKTRLSIKHGTTIIDDRNHPGVTNALNKCRVWNVPVVTFIGGAYECFGEISMEGGTFTITNCYLRKEANSTHKGDFNIASGTFRTIDSVIESKNSPVLKIGGVYSAQTSYKATYEMDGGSMNMHGGIQMGVTGTGTFNLHGGLVLNGEMSNTPDILGVNASGVGTLNISGGEWRILGYPWGGSDGKGWMDIGQSGSGTVNVSGTGVLSLVPGQSSPNCRSKVYVAKNAGSTGVLNLNEGGTFLTHGYGITGGEGTSSLVFNGGTFRKDSSATVGDFVEQNMTTVAVGPKGGVIDTDKHTLHLYDPIGDLDPTEVPTGFFRKRGSGTLTFHGANTYSATTFVEAGNIALADAGALSPNSPLWVDSGVTVDLTGAAAQTVGGLGGKGTISNVSLTTAGPICPGGTNEVGTLTLSSCPLTLAQGARLVIDVDAEGNCDKLVVTGANAPVNLSNLIIEVVNAGEDRDAIGPIIQCNAGVTGQPLRVVGTKSIALSSDANGNVRLSKPGTMVVIR